MIRPRFSRDIILEEGHWALPYQPSSFCSPLPHGKLLAGQESNYSVLILTSLVLLKSCNCHCHCSFFHSCLSSQSPGEQAAREPILDFTYAHLSAALEHSFSKKKTVNPRRMRRELIMAGNRIDLLDQAFDDHPSLSASLEDFEHHEDPSPLLPLPSQHSGFKSDSSETGADTNQDEPWSPPGWRNQGASNSWYRHQPYQDPIPHLKPPHTASRSRETSPAYENYESARESAKDDYDITIPANIPLPRGSLSPVKERSASPVPFQEAEQQQGFGKTYEAPEAPEEQTPPSDPNNCAQAV